MKHAMLALLVFSLAVTGGLERSFFLADDTPICLVVVADDASFDDLLTAAQIAKEIVDLAGSGCPFSLIRFEEEISKEDTAKYNLVVLGEIDLNLKGDPAEVADGLLLYENPFGTKRHVLVVENAQSLLDLLQDL
ncbi:MAG: hypothetical protein HXS52_08100 [Theionarchaea archaeon]|nr:hypothetical protein [Theionarchaea archaeon]MBU7037878.1 hypothetical protein [Theionarchaea archaeon]